MMLFKNTKAMICSLDGDTDYLNIVTEVFQGDTLAVMQTISRGTKCMIYCFLHIHLLKPNSAA